MKVDFGGVVLVVYGSIAAAIAFVNVVELVRLGMWGPYHLPYLPLRLQSRRALFARSRSTASSVALGIGHALIWPVSYGPWVRQAKLLNTEEERTLKAHHFLHPDLLLEAGILFVGVLIFFFIHSFLGVDLKTLFLVVVTSVTMTLVGWVLSYNSVALSLRHSAYRYPYVAFLSLAVITIAALVLALSGLRGHEQGRTSLESLKAAARDLLLFGRLRFLLDLFDVRTLGSGLQDLLESVGKVSRYDWLAAMAGLAFEIAFFRAIWGWKAFRRTEEDFCLLAQLHLDMGQLEEARKWLEKDYSGSYEADMVRIGVLLCRYQLDDAVKCYQDLWCRYHRQVPTRDEVFRSILVLADHYGLHRQSLARLSEEWFTAPVSDLSLLYVINCTRDSFLAVLEPFLAQAKTSGPMILSSAQILLEEDHELRRLHRLHTCHRAAQILMHEEAHKRAEDLLSQVTLPTSAEEVLRRLLLLQSRIPSDPIVLLQELRRRGSWLHEAGPFRQVDVVALKQKFEEWCRQNLTFVEAWAMSTASRFERTVVGPHLFRTLKIAETLRVRREEVELIFYRNQEHLILDQALLIHSTKALVNLPEWLV